MQAKTGTRTQDLPELFKSIYSLGALPSELLWQQKTNMHMLVNITNMPNNAANPAPSKSIKTNQAHAICYQLLKASKQTKVNEALSIAVRRKLLKQAKFKTV